jgi:signal transduction histidine kinase
MRRLYLQIYVALLGALGLFGVLVAGVWTALGPNEHASFQGATELLGELLPAADRPASELQEALDRLAARRLGLSISVYAGDGERIASVGDPLPGPHLDLDQSHWRHARGGRATAVPLADGRWLVIRGRHPPHGGGWIAGLVLLGVAVGGGAYPVARRLTRRIERLRQRVDALGSGDLSARVDEEGRDEVADLARSFNQSAERIERLVIAQRGTLAAASHELRSPLTRMRVAIDLLGAEARPDVLERIASDIAELDDLIDELLLASRLEAGADLERSDPVDLLALVAEEGARVDAVVTGQPTRLRGDARLLRRLAHNLFENARRHGAGTDIEARVEPTPDGGARLEILDRGPGVPEPERERIFEPFYRPPGTREGEGGVGLGLALVRRIATHHGGQARCRARPGGGTCFEVELASRQP